MSATPHLAAPVAAPAPSTASSIFEALVAAIVRGNYPAGSRLPAERDLARLLGASRPTLREALRRLSEWNMVEARRGSGVVVHGLEQWTIEALPAYLRYARPGDGPSIAEVARDVLELRRITMVDLIRLLDGRMPPGATRLAREHARQAWAARHDPMQFARQDFQIVRALAEAANSYPSMWMVNRIAGVYLDIAGSLVGTRPPPDEYPAVHEAVLDCIDANDTATAADVLDGYLRRHDALLLAAMMGAP